jgi:hypothetical protein
MTKKKPAPKTAKKAPKAVAKTAPTKAAITRVKVADIAIEERATKYRALFDAAAKAPIGEGVEIPLNGTILATRQRVSVALGRYAARKGEGYVLRTIKGKTGVFVVKAKILPPKPKAAKKAKK